MKKALCDKCGSEIPPDFDETAGVLGGPFNAEQNTYIEVRFGMYPKESKLPMAGASFSVDLCPRCWATHVVAAVNLELGRHNVPRLRFGPFLLDS